MLERIEHDRTIFAAMLGGPDRTTLFLLAAEWRGIEHVDEVIAAEPDKSSSPTLASARGSRFALPTR